MPETLDKVGEDSSKRNYKWPWLVLAAVIVAVVLAVVWVSFAVKQVERERGTGAPIRAGTN